MIGLFQFFISFVIKDIKLGITVLNVERYKIKWYTYIK
jgi:hypothetical protein